MSYRDDRDALRERVEQLEKKIASAVSPDELDAVHKELAAAKDRLDSERAVLDALLGKLEPKPLEGRRPTREILFVAAVTVALLAAGAVLIVFMGNRFPTEPSYEGAPNAVRVRPVRREIDREIARLMPDLDGCLPEGNNARIQVEMIFEGRDGRLRELTPRNISEHDAYPPYTSECLEGVLQGVGTAPFSAASYRYHLTLEWSDGRLQTPPIWERYDLARDPREGAGSR